MIEVTRQTRLRLITSRGYIRRGYLLAGVGALALVGFPCVGAQAVETAQGGGVSTAQPAEVADGNVLEVITVTARKYTERLQDVPVAASVVTATQLERYSLTDLSSLGSRVPSVSFDTNSQGSGGSSLTIRGIGSSGEDSAIEQAVALVMDGIQTSRGRFIQQAVFDLEQVEVLKGPQALFFGKNSPGGVVSLRAKGPTDNLELQATTGYEFNADERIVDGVISGPISDTLRARAAVHSSDMRGWEYNTAESVPNPFFGAIPGVSANTPGKPFDYNSSRDIAGRLTIDYRPSSNLTVTLRGFGSYASDNGNHANSEFIHCAKPPLPDVLGLQDPFGDCKINGRNSSGALDPALAASDPRFGDGKPYGRYKSYLASVTTDYTTGPLVFTSVSGYVGYSYDHIDSGQFVYAYPFGAYTEDFNQYSQELRFLTTYDAPVNFAGGLYVENSHVSLTQATILFPTPPDPRTGEYDSWALAYGSNGNAYSAFSQVKWKLATDVELAAGARYTNETKTGSTRSTFINQAFIPGTTLQYFTPNGVVAPQSPEGTVFAAKVKSNNVSPEATLTWHPVADTMLYGAFKTGYKSGGISAPDVPKFSGGHLTYKPEKAKGGEIGVKATALGNTLRLTSAIYRYDYTDLQINNYDAVHNEQEALNVGGARTQGVESELEWKVLRGLTFNAGVGYSHSRYTSFPGIACYAGQSAAEGCNLVNYTQSLTGQARVRAPDWTGNFGFDYETPAFGELMFGVSGWARFSSKYFTQENNSPLAVQGAYHVIDASMRLFSQDNRYELALIGRNLNDERYIISSLDNPESAPGTIEGTISRPRQLLLEATFRYR